MFNFDAHRRTIGASMIGLAFVFLAIVINNLTTPHTLPAQNQAPAAAKLDVTIPDREFIAVADANSDGIEDWREEFVVTAPVSLPANSSTTTPFSADTVTDQVGIQLFESLVRNKNLGGVQSNDALIAKTTSRINELAVDTLYTNRDIIIIPTSPDAVKTYGNTMGQSITNHNIPDSENELEILDRAIRTNNDDEMAKLSPIALMYKNLRDDALATPVPEAFADEHLVVINGYHVMYRNLTDFQMVFSDPVLALLRIKRYQDDATGLAIALNNLYRAAAPYHSLFTEDDPAMVFLAFRN
jgi:hypothetical protein